MSRALELFCCHYLLSPCSGPSTSVSFLLTRLSPLHSHTQLSLCDVSLLLLLLLISRWLPALLVLAFYETFQKIAFMMLLLSLSVLFTFQMFYSIPLCVGKSFHFLHCSLLRVVMVVLSVFVFVPAPVYWCDPRGFVLHGLRKNLTNFECVYFLFPSKIVFFLCALFLSLCVSKNSKCNA